MDMVGIPDWENKISLRRFADQAPLQIVRPTGKETNGAAYKK